MNEGPNEPRAPAPQPPILDKEDTPKIPKTSPNKLGRLFSRAGDGEGSLGLETLNPDPRFGFASHDGRTSIPHFWTSPPPSSFESQ
mmetsp:Transcript_4697/g.5240  ORF Transcript_4697/g.5240 Transcript_4697/m.5240 type:complete len:86 (+) Transcript_4697:764-1021(+)